MDDKLYSSLSRAYVTHDIILLIKNLCYVTIFNRSQFKLIMNI